MKRIFVLSVFAFLITSVFAQNINQSNIPAVVLNAFKLKFANARDVKWKLEKGNYLVYFEMNNKDNKLVMSDRGKIVKHEQDLYVSEIPKAVLETIKSRVEFFDVNDADRIEDGGNVSYKVNFEINEKDHDFLIDERGKLLKYTKELRDSEVPASIINFISTKYGSLDIDEAKFMEENGKTGYFLKGEISDKDHDFIIDSKTTLVLHNQDLRNSEIPSPVMNAVKKAYNGYEIRDADLKEEGRKVTYTIQLRKSKDNIYVIFSPFGNILEVKKD